MKLWLLIWTRGISNPLAFLATAITATMADSLVYLAVAGAVESPGGGHALNVGLPALITVIILAGCGRWITQAQISAWFAEMVASIRRTLLASAVQMEPSAWERLSKVEFRQGLSALPARLTNVGDNAASAVYSAVQGGVTCFFLFLLYWPIGVAAVLAYTLTGICLGRMAVKSTALELSARAAEDAVRGGLTDLVLGRTELLLDPGKADALFAETVAGNVLRRKAARAPVRTHLLRQAVLNQTIEPGLAGVATLCVALSPDAYARPEPLIALLLVYSLPYAIFQVAPQIISGEAGAAQLEALEQRIQAQARLAPTPDPPSRSDEPFEKLELRDIRYRYADGRNRFMVGPLSLEFVPGTVTFISGGNGSGKSTLIKILTGIYPPRGGTALLNGQPVDLRRHRNLFSLILSDHYLFDRLFGLSVDPARVNEMLQLFGLDKVTSYQDGRFTRLDLSSGQKKRVGLIVALLENKPVLVLDEWAAEQDPAMRRRYYREILPELRAENRAIIAVTHDDQYLDACDRLIAMRDGQISYAGPPDGLSFRL